MFPLLENTRIMYFSISSELRLKSHDKHLVNYVVEVMHVISGLATKSMCKPFSFPLSAD